MQCVVLAAGKGTRLHPVTLHRTKAMAPVAGKPMVERVLTLFVENGITDIILITSPTDDEIRRHFADPNIVGARSIRVVEQIERLGMAHALRLAVPHLHGDFLLTACDNLVPSQHIADLLDVHRQRSASATLSLMEIDASKTASTGIIAWQDGEIERIVEKPQPAEAPSNISSLPLYLFSPKLLPHLARVEPSPRGEYELQDAIQMLIDVDGGVTGAMTLSRRQLTNVDDLLALNRHFLHVEAENDRQPPNKVGENPTLIPPVYLEPDVIIGHNCAIGPNVVIEQGCIIGDGVTLRNTLVLRDRQVESGSLIEDQVVA